MMKGAFYVFLIALTTAEEVGVDEAADLDLDDEEFEDENEHAHFFNNLLNTVKDGVNKVTGGAVDKALGEDNKALGEPASAEGCWYQDPFLETWHKKSNSFSGPYEVLKQTKKDNEDDQGCHRRRRGTILYDRRRSGSTGDGNPDFTGHYSQLIEKNIIKPIEFTSRKLLKAWPGKTVMSMKQTYKKELGPKGMIGEEIATIKEQQKELGKAVHESKENLQNGWDHYEDGPHRTRMRKASLDMLLNFHGQKEWQKATTTISKRELLKATDQYAHHLRGIEGEAKKALDKKDNKLNEEVDAREAKMMRMIVKLQSLFTTKKGALKHDWKTVGGTSKEEEVKLRDFYAETGEEFRKFKKELTKAVGVNARIFSGGMSAMRRVTAEITKGFGGLDRQALVALEGLDLKTTTALRRFVKEAGEQLVKEQEELAGVEKGAWKEMKSGFAIDTKRAHEQQKVVERQARELERMKELQMDAAELSAGAVSDSISHAEEAQKEVGTDYRKLKSEMKIALKNLEEKMKADRSLQENGLDLEVSEQKSAFKNYVERDIYNIYTALEKIGDQGQEEGDLLQQGIDALNSLTSAVTEKISQDEAALGTEKQSFENMKRDAELESRDRKKVITNEVAKILRPLPVLAENARHEAIKLADDFDFDAKTTDSSLKKHFFTEVSRLNSKLPPTARNVANQLETLKTAHFLPLDALKENLNSLFHDLEHIVGKQTPAIHKNIEDEYQGMLNKTKLQEEGLTADGEKMLQNIENRTREIQTGYNSKLAAEVSKEAKRLQVQKDDFKKNYGTLLEMADAFQNKAKEWAHAVSKRQRGDKPIVERVQQLSILIRRSVSTESQILKDKLAAIQNAVRSLGNFESAKAANEDALKKTAAQYDTVEKKIDSTLQDFVVQPNQDLKNLRSDAEKTTNELSEGVTKLHTDSNETLEEFRQRISEFDNQEVMRAAASSSYLKSLEMDIAPRQAKLAEQRVAEAKKAREEADKITEAAKAAHEKVQNEMQEANAHIKTGANAMDTMTARRMKQMYDEAAANSNAAKEKLEDAEAWLKKNMKAVEKASEQLEVITAENPADPALLARAKAATTILAQTESGSAQLIQAQSADISTLAEAVSESELAHHVLGSINETVNKLQATSNKNFEDRVAAAYQRLAHGMLAGSDGAANLAKETEDMGDRYESRTKELDTNVENLFNNLEGNKEEETKVMAQAFKHLDNERDELKFGANEVQEKVTTEQQILARQMTKMLPGIESALDEAEDQRTKSFYSQEKTIEKLQKSADDGHEHDEDEVLAAESAVQKMNMKHDQLMAWSSGLKHKDLVWKQMVEEKLKELGVEIKSEALSALSAQHKATQDAHTASMGLEGETEKEISEVEKKANAELATIYAEQDAAIAKLMNDESLTEEQRQKMIKELREDTRQKADAIFRAQAAGEQQQAADEASMERYMAMVDAAQAATQRAILEGKLAPSALAVQKKLHQIGIEIENLRKKARIGSVIQVSSNDMLLKAAQQAQSVLKGMNDTLEELQPQSAPTPVAGLVQVDDQLEESNNKLREEVQHIQEEIKARAI